MASPARQFDAVDGRDRLFEIVRTLITELGHQAALASIAPEAHLDKELGLGSLERVELLVRLEREFGTRLDEQVLSEAETIQDLIAALESASSSTGSERASGASAPPGTESAKLHVVATVPKPARAGLAEGLPTAETFQDVLRQRARLSAAETHLIFFEDEGESKTLTFGELFSGAERVSAELLQRGIGRGDRVALMLPTSHEFFLTYAGILLAGATPVPIYTPFRADRIAEFAERQSAILANAGVRLLVTFREAASVARMLKPRVPTMESVATSEQLIESQAPPPIGMHLHSRPEDLALLQYTSGSTGRPKGVMLTHANLLANIHAIGVALGMRNDDVGVSWLPLYHDMGLIGAWLMPLYFGLPVVVMSPLAFLSRPVRWLQALDRFGGTITAAPNFAYELAAAKVSDEDLSKLDLRSLRAALNGAEPVLPATLERFAARFAPCGFRREALLPVYGLAEASLAVAIPTEGRGPRVDRLDRAALVQQGRAVPADTGESSAPGAEDESNTISFVSVGNAVPGMEIRIADEHGEDAGERVEGQLWFRSPSATAGYYQNETATAALFPRTPAEGWIDSGDRAYRADGKIYITGRVKDIIIHAGSNLYPHEIEDAVAQVPGVRKGCVVAFGAPNPATGTERLVIVAESRQHDAGPRMRISREITALVTTVTGVPPDEVEIVPPNAIPKTSSGKLRRDETRRRFLAGGLRTSAPPAWLQIARLAAGSSARRLRGTAKRLMEIVYGIYATSLFAVVLLTAWVLVMCSTSQKYAGRVTTLWLRFFFKAAGWRLRAKGIECMSENAPCMLIANHASYTDVLVLISVLGGGFRIVAKGELRTAPFVGTFLRKLGHFTFDREDPADRLHQAKEIEESLREGKSVLVFPEGTFTAQPGVRPFHLGAFQAALAAGRPIIPVALDGTRRALRDGTMLMRRGNVRITLGPALVPQSDANEWQEVVRLRDAAREIIGRNSGESLL